MIIRIEMLKTLLTKPNLATFVDTVWEHGLHHVFKKFNFFN